MWIKRDFLNGFRSEVCLEAIYLKGPRQIGKSSILGLLEPTPATILFMDDYGIRARAQQDPAFLLSETKLPVLIDEAHLAPEIFFAIKNKIDQSRRERIQTNVGLAPCSFRLTGSNLTAVNISVQETLAGRVNIFFLHGISWHEIKNFDSEVRLSEYLFRGGFPELWIRKELNPIAFINDYIANFIEKDLARSIGIEKRNEFLSVLRLTAARVGELINYDSIGNDADVKGKTVKQWLALLEENRIIHILEPYSNNLNQRLIKMPKIYFLDMGICTRLQSHQSADTILNSPHAGHLFESLVVAEVVKTKDHFQKEWNLYFWRTKEKEEIDLIIEEPSRITLIEVKLGSSAQAGFSIPKTIQNIGKPIRSFVVTASGTRHRLQTKGGKSSCESVPISELVSVLMEP